MEALRTPSLPRKEQKQGIPRWLFAAGSKRDDERGVAGEGGYRQHDVGVDVLAAGHLARCSCGSALSSRSDREPLEGDHADPRLPSRDEEP